MTYLTKYFSSESKFQFFPHCVKASFVPNINSVATYFLNQQVYENELFSERFCWHWKQSSYFSCLLDTVWNFANFSASQILREINFSKIKVSKAATKCNLKYKIYQNQFHVKSKWEKNGKFPHCAVCIFFAFEPFFSSNNDGVIVSCCWASFLRKRQVPVKIDYMKKKAI